MRRGLTRCRHRDHMPRMRLSILLAVRVLALFTLAFAAPVLAQAPPAQTSTDQMRRQAVAIATQWLEANTAYKAIPEIRNWVVVSPDQMAQQAVRGHVLGDSRQVSAIYSCGEDKLYFLSGVNFYDVAILSILVHELTHHAQCAAHVPMQNLCPIEREAYLNQQRFLRALPDRLARAGTPLSTAAATAVADYATGIDKLIDTVCRAAAAH